MSPAKSIGGPRLGARHVVPIRVSMQRGGGGGRRVQSVKPAGVVARHGVLVEVAGRHWAVRIELARGLAVQRLLLTLRTRGPRRRIVVIHILRLRGIVAHDWQGGTAWSVLQEMLEKIPNPTSRHATGLCRPDAQCGCELCTHMTNPRTATKGIPSRNCPG